MKRILGFLTLLFLLFTSGCNQQPEGESAISEESTVSEESTFEYYKGRPQDVSIPVQCYETPPENPVVLFDDAQGAYLFDYVEEELVGTTKTIVVNGKELVGDYRKTSMSWVPAPVVDYFCAGSDEDRYEAVLFSITQLYDELMSITFTPNYNCVIDIPIGVEEAREICKADDNVDSMFSKIVLEVCGIITENPQNVMCDVDLIFITKYAERMADHATNIAEWVIYMETGVHPDLNTKVV